MAQPVAFSILIVGIILVPLYTLQGIEGKMFAPLASTMLIAMIVSLAGSRGGLRASPALAREAAALGPLHLPASALLG